MFSGPRSPGRSFGCALLLGLTIWWMTLIAATGQAQTPDQQNAAAPATPPPAPAALPTPSITGPLQGLPPAIFDAGPFGTVAVNGFLSGMGLWQSNHIPGDDSTQAALSNGQVVLQRTDGWFQFYLQAGAYNIPVLGVSFLATDKTVTDLYGPLPVGFLKLAPGKNTSIMIGALPTLMGAESTFTFQNMNIERGLLWNQENAIARGIQVNQTMGKFTASLSWNDGFYSNRYNWLSGALTYANGPHSLAFEGWATWGRQLFGRPPHPCKTTAAYTPLSTRTPRGPGSSSPTFNSPMCRLT